MGKQATDCHKKVLDIEENYEASCNPKWRVKP
jgi:hypothetical protein